MRVEQKGPGLLVYEKEQEDRVREAVAALAKMSAQQLDDSAAARLGALFPVWEPGKAYTAGARIADGEGNLYKVVQDHVAQAEWPLEETAALYTRLGVTAEDPGAIPDWKQPAGAHDAYQSGERVRWNGTVYQSIMDGNVWAPDVQGWLEVDA